MQYLHDDLKTDLYIADMQFSSPSRGMAVGFTADRSGGSRKNTALLTSDGGAHWETLAIKGEPGALFFLNDSLGWMVSGKNLWKITEMGKKWARLPNPPERVVRVYFTDEKTGWAACQNKTVLKTQDGGAHWEKVAAAAEPPVEPRSSAYTWIAFGTPETGIITGWNPPPARTGRSANWPDWMDPEAVLRRREVPRLNIMLSTIDGGKNWKSSSLSMFGELTRIRFGPGGNIFALVEHSPSFQYPSEVHNLRATAAAPVYRDPNVFITDLWATPGGAVYLAGVSANDKIRMVPQKVRVLRSDDLRTWRSIPVDYRAVARRTFLAGAADGSLWMATDNGMILKLAE